MIRTTIYLPDDIHQSLKLLAVKRKTNMTAIIIELLGKHALIENPEIAKKNYPLAFSKPLPKPDLLNKKRGELNAGDY